MGLLRTFLPCVLTLGAAFAAYGQPMVTCEKADGYHGIWYANQATKDEYVYKYSGGLGTYCAKHIPMAVYAPEVNKTFFVYGGVHPGERSLLEMVSYFDHETGTVPKPSILLDKKTSDAHDNPVLSIDADGYLWVFASAHGTARPAYIYKSADPYDINRFELVLDQNFSYPQPWYLDEKGFLFLHTRYQGGRILYWMTSATGHEWSDGKRLAAIGEGHYQVSWPHEETVGTAFNYHPEGRGLNFRTNLYYVQTRDMGKTWTTVDGESIDTPVTTVQNRALVHDYEADGLLVYMKDLNYDADGNPVILHVVSKGWQPGPENGPQEWRVAHWTGEAWRISTAGTSDNNYDTGSIHVMANGAWRVVGPLDTGPQPYNPGGEVTVVVSGDNGKTWEREHTLTANSAFNHTYVRRPLNATPSFQAFWADGHGRQRSESRLYFWDAEANRAYRFPENMESAEKEPEPLPNP